MAYEFIKLSEVPVTEFDADTGLQNAIIEEEGEIKRVPLYTLSAGPSEGGFKYFYMLSGYLYEASGAHNRPDTGSTEAVDEYVFKGAFYSSPVMVNFEGSYAAPVLNWYEASGAYNLVHIGPTGGVDSKKAYFTTSN